MPNSTNLIKYLEWALRASLFLLALAAPLSIAVTQIAWSFALLFWLIRAFFVRSHMRKDGVGIATLAFVGLTLVSSFFSYEPQVSLRKMVGVALVTIVYLVSDSISDAKWIRRLIVIMLVSAAFTAAYTIGQTAIGKNLKVVHFTANSPLLAAGVKENDTIQTVNGKSINTPDELASAVASASENGIAKLHVYHYELFFDYDMPVSALLQSADNAGRFGITEWSRGRDIRAAGFYGHYTTYAEATQLIASLALGLLILVPGGFFTRNRIVLAVTLAAFCAGLFLTVTRASWAGFLISAAIMILVGTTRKTILFFILCAVPISVAGLCYLQQKRNVAFVDTSDGSTTWRMMVWREGFGVLVSSPRHLAVGIGMDSLKTHWQDWKMFDNGWQPMGHMHSTPLEFAFERGLPVLIVWIMWMFFYLRMLWRGFRRKDLDWFERGILLGSLGGAIGFLSSGLVHYNWGDSEVVMIFYLLMGLSLAVLGRKPEPTAEALSG